MRYLSVCSGIEAATVAWRPLGWEAVAFSQHDPDHDYARGPDFPSAVLAHHYPETPNWGDMEAYRDWPDADVDVLIGGTPCQDFSVAGLRAGIAAPRGNLTLVYLGVVERYRPRWVVWENVPGARSVDGGRALGAFLGGLAELGYGWAYRSLDAQYFGLAQRRERVFVVGCAGGDWQRAAEVLFEPESLSGNTPACVQARKDAARRAAAPSGGGRLWRQIARAFGAGGAVDGPEIAGAVSAKWRKGTGGPAGDECYNLVAHSLRGTGFDASEDGTGRGTPIVPVVAKPIGSHRNGGPRTDLDGDTYVAFDLRGRDGGAMPEGPHDTANIRAASGGSSRSYVAFSSKDHGADAGEISPTLRAMGYAASHANGGGQVAVAFNHQTGGDFRPMVSKDCANALQKSQGQAVAHGYAIRRLTPVECERLQGFPEIQKTYTIQICRDCSDQQKRDARAALKCPKSPSNVWLADASGWTLSAEAAADHSNTHHHAHEPPVAVDVLIDLERQAVRLHSHGRSSSPVNSAGNRGEFPLPTGIDSIAHLVALLMHAWGLATLDGRAASQASTTPSILLQNGSGIVLLSGREIGERASDAATAIAMATHLSTSTTLPSGLDIQTYGSMLETLCCCVAHAIGSYIPERTSKANCFAVRLTTSQGYTRIPWRGKPADLCPDGRRYEALGNSMPVPVIRWIGDRIATAESAP